MEAAVKNLIIARYWPRTGKAGRAASIAGASARRAAACFLCLFLILCGSASAFAQMRSERAPAWSTAAAKATFDTSLPGKWTYRSYDNRADVMVAADPDPAVQALDPIYGQGNAGTASAAMKALNLLFGEG